MSNSSATQWDPLIHLIVSKFITGYPYLINQKEDLIQAGREAVLRGEAKYDPERGAILKTYLYRCVHNAIHFEAKKEGRSYKQKEAESRRHFEAHKEIDPMQVALDLLALEQILSDLEDPRQTIIQHLYLADPPLSVTAVAKLMGLKPDLVREVRDAALEALKVYLSQQWRDLDPGDDES